MKKNPKYYITSAGFWMCMLGATFYFYDFFIRVSPSVMTEELMSGFHVRAAGLGLISSVLFLTYTIMQIPAGLLIDHFGVKRPLAYAVLCCAGSVLWFSMTQSALNAAVAFGVVGVTSGFAYIAALVLASRWFPNRHFALVVGLVQMLGCVGAVGAQAPLHFAIQAVGWRYTMMVAAGIGLVLFFLYLFLIREYPKGHEPAEIKHRALVDELRELWGNLMTVLRAKSTWWVGLYTLLIWTPTSIFTSLWGIPAMEQFYHFSPAVSASVCSVIWIGVSVAGPLMGGWSDSIGKRRMPMILIGIVGAASTAGLLYVPSKSIWVVGFWLFWFGVASGAGQAVSFGLVRDNNDDSRVGTAVGFNNMMCILGTPIFQPLLSWLLEIHWTGKLVQGAPVYSATNYRMSLVLMPLLFAASWFVAQFLIRDRKKPLRSEVPLA